MQELGPDSLLTGKDEAARVMIAERAGKHLADDDLSDADRAAAEMLVRELAEDAVERVRCALSMAVKHARYLPLHTALKIAHDVDSVACPFLEVTEVFSESDWERLLLTISRGACVAVARRSSMTEAMARCLSETGDSVVAETLVENPSAPMTVPVCDTLIERFASDIWIVDKLALRDDLIAGIAVKLTLHVSAAVREKLCNSYDLPKVTEQLAGESETGAVLELVRKTPEQDLVAVAQTLNNQNKLTPPLLLKTLEEGQTAFIEAALSIRSGRSLEHVRSVIRRAGQDAVNQLLERSTIPQPRHQEFWEALEIVRGKE